MMLRVHRMDTTHRVHCLLHCMLFHRATVCFSLPNDMKFGRARFAATNFISFGNEKSTVTQ